MLRSVENAGPFPAAPVRAAPPAPDGEPSPAEAAGTPGGAPPDAPAADGAAAAREAEAWAQVLEAWEDEARHRAYLARFTDLDGLALAGRRYREALLARPGDAMAARQRDEVVRRALARGLAAMPTPRAGSRRSRLASRAAALALLGALAAAALLALRSVGPHLGAFP